MRRDLLKTNEELIGEQLRTDPEFRSEWQRTPLGRAVAVAIVRYRGEHGLSQRALAERLLMKQPQVARLELGEVNPTIETVMRISAQLGIEFRIEVRPGGCPAATVTEPDSTGDLLPAVDTSGAQLHVDSS